MIRVMVVDDSSVVRQLMQELLSATSDIQVVATASDPIFAMRKMRQDWPDVIVLDIEMPRMDGITFLKQIMALRPTPVIICSARTDGSADITMDALAAGAVGVIAKPALGVRDFLQDSSADLANAIRAAAQAQLTRNGVGAASAAVSMTPPEQVFEPIELPLSGHRAETRAPKAPPRELRHHDGWIVDLRRHSADAVLDAPGAADAFHPTTGRIVAIGASTGGPQALELVLGGLSSRSPGVVVVQHMPESFTRSFAERLHKISPVDVKEAEHLDLVVPGRVLIAPGGRHLVVKRDGQQYFVEVIDGPLVSRHKPSVDVLFRSMAKAAGSNAVGIIMTGMGDDGARGLKEMAERGAATYAQDERSSIVFGMPKEAIQLGGVGDVISLENISAVIEQYGFREPE
ncbi:chemotaxis response regulator protein-glutamate methylesterase [Herbaspirillum sp. LeCh32-8]|uniref:protein-glutamate methylesterase/protein-glutamine glutaminase n=1 Tax=Herbaspirillum sp. LeCh32-8 TaxID=2821356 RepID=UPI001AE22BD6|nr:chemotaxis response regulator protein-glutamate methylesterase [Herbaspirillum sp. LeCh32-8]MBP0600318.1 chemotaxis response regulator protein-glutamate methylesterase [Herbaspirillum sp. LeCh32-8]